MNQEEFEATKEQLIKLRAALDDIEQKMANIQERLRLMTAPYKEEVRKLEKKLRTSELKLIPDCPESGDSSPADPGYYDIGSTCNRPGKVAPR